MKKLLSCGLTFGSLFFIMLTMLNAEPPVQLDKANYFRVWQGFKHPDLTSEQFVATFPPFMKETVTIYGGRALINYIVVIPPADKPAYVPDEFALVALTSKQDYELIRATPEGQNYLARHWIFFDKSKSKSADPLVNYEKDHPASLAHNTSYDMISNPMNWATGYNAVFIGTRKSGLDATQFLTRLKSHVELTKSVMVPMGLNGYIFIANEQYEIAYLNWESKEKHDQAGQTPEAQAAFKDAEEFMDVLLYTQAVPFQAGSPIQPGKAYSTLQ